MSEMIRTAALAICRSRTCEGASCCQWPANRGRTDCNAKQGAYDDAARDAISAIADTLADRLAQSLRSPGVIQTYHGYRIDEPYVWGEILRGILKSSNP